MQGPHGGMWYKIVIPCLSTCTYDIPLTKARELSPRTGGTTHGITITSVLLDASFWFGIVHCIYRGVTGYNFQIRLYFLLFLANRRDPGEILHCALFHLGLYFERRIYESIRACAVKLDSCINT